MRASALVASAAVIFLQTSCVPGDDSVGEDGVGAAGSGGAGPGGTGAGGTAATGGQSGTSGAAGTGVGGTTGGTGATGGVGGSNGGAPTGGSGLGGAGVSGGGNGGSPAGSGGVGGTGGAGAGGGGGKGGAAGAGAGGKGGAAGAGGAGGKGGAAGAGGGGGGTFAPCPATGVCRILPLGDSITDGLTVMGGYRIELFSLSLENMKEITFVGGSMNGPQMVDGVTFPRSHEGHSGWTIMQIDGIVPSPALNPMPHIILLHIGTNDMNGSASGAPTRLGTLIDQIIAGAPNALLAVSNIIPFPGRANDVMTYNAAVPGVVQMRQAAGAHIIFVDQFMGFPTNELQDGVHPNSAGYARMAAKWYAAISSYLP